jgi:hypothetical protein
MKWIAGLLLVGVFFRHSAHTWLAGTMGIPVAGWFYVLGGVWEVLLCAVLALMFGAMREDRWARVAFAAMLIGIAEGAQMAGCRLMIEDMSKLPRGVNICDAATGLPIGAAFFSLYLIIIGWTVFRERKTKNEQ